MRVTTSLLIYQLIVFMGLVGCSGRFEAARVFSSVTNSSLSSPVTSPAAGVGTGTTGITPPVTTPTPSVLATEMASPTFTSFPSSYFTLTPASGISVGGVTLKLTMDADLQVVNGSGAVLWHTGSVGACDATCRLVLQNDGNLVLYKSGAAIWGANTDNGGAMLTLSSVAPYFTVRDGNFRVMYPTAGDRVPKQPRR